MLSKPPDQHQWTLLFRHHKTTILLFVSQSQSFTSIKAQLLEAIKASGITKINDQDLPSDPGDVIFGVPIDRYDLNRGWIDLEIPDLDEEDGKSKKRTNVLNASPMGAGLKDGSTLAFKFRKERSEDDDLDMDDGEWDVLIPNFDEDHGTQTKAKGGLS